MKQINRNENTALGRSVIITGVGLGAGGGGVKPVVLVPNLQPHLPPVSLSATCVHKSTNKAKLLALFGQFDLDTISKARRLTVLLLFLVGMLIFPNALLHGPTMFANRPKM